MTRRFTGWHMTSILVSFFSIVIAVNLIMARFAVGTFGGTVVDNSYVASQNYNRWLAQADKQEKLGWVSRISLDPARRIHVSISKEGIRITGVNAIGLAVHPLGRAPSIPLAFAPLPDGTLLTRQRLPAGRWRVQLSIEKDRDTVKLIEPVQ
jgi:nitrogen fixation protein FixH